MELSGGNASHQVVIEIGGIPVGLHTTDAAFVGVLQGRYRDYVKSGMEPEFSSMWIWFLTRRLARTQI